MAQRTRSKNSRNIAGTLSGTNALEPLIRSVFPIGLLTGTHYNWITVAFICTLIILTSLFLHIKSPAAKYFFPNFTKKDSAFASGVIIAAFAIFLRTITSFEIIWAGTPFVIIILLKMFPYDANGMTTADDSTDSDDAGESTDPGAKSSSASAADIRSRISAGIIAGDGSVQSAGLASQIGGTSSPSLSAGTSSSTSDRQKRAAQMRQRLHQAQLDQSEAIVSMSNSLKTLVADASNAAESFISGR